MMIEPIPANQAFQPAFPSTLLASAACFLPSSVLYQKLSQKKKLGVLKRECPFSAPPQHLSFDTSVSREFIEIKGARTHNLQNISVRLPRFKLTVVTGISGSGKSSLAVDTLYAEGQRRYVESLSTYARQFFARLPRPDVDMIEGLSPAIVLEQKPPTQNPRSTVGTVTEIYDYLRVLMARVGVPTDPTTGKPLRRWQPPQVTEDLLTHHAGKIVVISTPSDKPLTDEEKQRLVYLGVRKIVLQGAVHSIDGVQEVVAPDKYELAIALIKISPQEEKRITEAVATAYRLSGGKCNVREHPSLDVVVHYTENPTIGGFNLTAVSDKLFSFVAPEGACPCCQGFGNLITIDERSVIPDPSLSIEKGAIACWRTPAASWYLHQLLRHAHKVALRTDVPYAQLSAEEKRLVWEGCQWFEGINDFFRMLEEYRHKIEARVFLARFRRRVICPQCGGSRLRKEALLFRLAGKNIWELAQMTINELADFLVKVKLTDFEAQVARPLLAQIHKRLHYLRKVGLGYLTLARETRTLSGGELQRIQLTRFMRSSLVNTLFVLDEPTVGLHPRDSERLLSVMKELCSIGNTVVVVEHDPTIIKGADFLIDMGPAAGTNGGKVVYAGPVEGILKCKESLTGAYLRGELKIHRIQSMPQTTHWLILRDASTNNLKKLTVRIPLNRLTVITGVSGSGKTTLLQHELYQNVKSYLQNRHFHPLSHPKLDGNLEEVCGVELVTQGMPQRSGTSLLATYIGVWTHIRNLYAQQPQARLRQLTPAHFAIGTSSKGACTECHGIGIVKVEMQFIADVELVCEMCEGKRFNEQVLSVKYRGKNVSEVLEMSVSEAIHHFEGRKDIQEILQVLEAVGLGYARLGQRLSTLSAGEVQRLKLTKYLSGSYGAPHLLLFDEPTTGMHPWDVSRLLELFEKLLERGHTIVCVEHNLDFIACAHWLIDLGPEGGKDGGYLLFEGTPHQLVNSPIKSWTRTYLRKHLRPYRESLSSQRA